MPRFLHISDIHLGYDRYDSKERTLDFFRALQDVIRKYAIAEQVDFVVIAGDLFEHRSLQPNILNQAKVCFQELHEAGIPTIAIEGNHDNRPYGTKTSWLRYLAEWYGLMLLEPGDTALGEPIYQPWNPDEKRGGYVDLDCGVRVIGSQWYGASAPKAIAQLAEAIHALPAPPANTVMLFHHGLEGQIARYQGALRYADLLPLKQAGVEYLALGHIHKNYEEQGWIFNPGSLEANNIDETSYKRGAYLVEINSAGIHAQLKQDYYQRPALRLKLTTRGQESLEELEESAIALVQQAIQSRKINPTDQPMMELKIEGQVGFDRLELDTRKLQQTLKQLSNALIFLLKYDVDSIEYASPLSDEASRLQIEQEIFIDLLTANNVYKKRAPNLAQGLIELKDLQLQGRSEAELYTFTESLLNQSAE
ncbi:DNA repair exonuclease [Phormidium sp. CLA17]|uniref:metallophosphoesterase family protein n=1 Tax=Leptolyngbya sp. Cla-17 TaxID=2803751 RepID=UPI001492F98F|nr:DNA repair exonuclease [Leptolyngbya sp. Cla-17]MBM0742474.1 DNA repair exonuclease [Leptolyngbya sp. Cla-17]